MSNPKQLARVGIFYLEEAILDVLFEVMETSPADPFVRAVDIARKIGVEQWTNRNWLTSDILKKLEAADRVEQREAGGPWKLTETEYQVRG